MTRSQSIAGALIVTLFLSGCGWFDEREEACDISQIQLESLGVDFEPWDGNSGSVAGGFKFSGPDNMMMPFGNVGDGGKVQSSLDFYMDSDATVFAPISGTISRVVFQSEDSDYEIEIKVGGCQVFFDHMLDPQVSVGDYVNAGDPLGKPGPWNEYTGVLELTVLSGRRVYCPVDFIRPERIDTVRSELVQLMADVETYHGDTSIYDEAAMLEPGCLIESFIPPD
ncbi:MAG: M23 family metallopeptidase [Spirochaetota bacterium]